MLRRDELKCCFCHFNSPKLEIINLDNDYGNNKKVNLISACELCAKCTLLDYYNLNYDGPDKIIYLPEISQEQLNQLCRILFCHMQGGDGDNDSSENESAYNAKIVYAQLQDRAGYLDEKTKTNLSHPALFVHYQSSAKADPKLINRLRWLPSPDNCQDYIAAWKEGLDLAMHED